MKLFEFSWECAGSACGVRWREEGAHLALIVFFFEELAVRRREKGGRQGRSSVGAAVAGNGEENASTAGRYVGLMFEC